LVRTPSAATAAAHLKPWFHVKVKLFFFIYFRPEPPPSVDRFIFLYFRYGSIMK